MKNKFNVNDWGYFEFELSYIKKMEKDKITCISTGYIETSGLDLNDRFFPLSVDIKRISGEVAFWSNRFHKECRKLNFPDIHRRLVRFWLDMVYAKDNEQKLKLLYDSLSDFGRTVIEKHDDLSNVKVGDVKIFK